MNKKKTKKTLNFLARLVSKATLLALRGMRVSGVKTLFLDPNRLPRALVS
jgi:hypothetical protein